MISLKKSKMKNNNKIFKSEKDVRKCREGLEKGTEKIYEKMRLERLGWTEKSRHVIFD